MVREVVTVKWRGMDDLLKGLTALPDIIEQRVLDKAMNAGANVLRDAARHDAPVRNDGYTKYINGHRDKIRQPGNLQRNIITAKNRFSAHTSRYQVGLRETSGRKRPAFYGQFIEIGSKHQVAHPYLGPALNSNHDQSVDAFAQSLGAGIQRELANLSGSVKFNYLTKGRA